MIIELFGLSRTGKTTARERLLKKGHMTMDNNSKPQTFVYFLKYLSKQPLKTLYLFFKLNTNHAKFEYPLPIKYLKMFFMRNSYLAGALSKYEKAVEKKGLIILEESSIQSIFIIMQEKSNGKELSKILKALPKPDKLFIFELSKKDREKRHDKTRYPAEWIEKRYALNWLKNSEHNYKIIKETLTNRNSKNDKIDIKFVRGKRDWDNLHNLIASS